MSAHPVDKERRLTSGIQTYSYKCVHTRLAHSYLPWSYIHPILAYMTQTTDFPFDLKNIITDCLLALFWVKADIIQFISECDVKPAELEVVRGNPSLSRKQIIADVFQRVALRSDKGFSSFEMMLNRLSQWNYFNPHWFDREKTLDRDQAENRLAELRRMIAARHAAQNGRSVFQEKVAKAKSKTRDMEELQKDFSHLATGKMSPQERGRLFEPFLRKLFGHFNISMSQSFRIVGEEIDGSFKFEGENYIVEAKWQSSSISTDALYKFAHKADGKMYGRGVFISINAYSWESLEAIVRGKHIKTILVDGNDLMQVISGQITLSQMLDCKIQAAQLRGDVYIDALTGKSKVAD